MLLNQGVCPVQSGSQEMDKSPQIQGEIVVLEAVCSTSLKRNRLGLDILLPFSGYLSQCSLVMCPRKVWYQYAHHPPYAKWGSLDGITCLLEYAARVVEVAVLARAHEVQNYNIENYCFRLEKSSHFQGGCPVQSGSQETGKTPKIRGINV